VLSLFGGEGREKLSEAIFLIRVLHIAVGGKVCARLRIKISFIPHSDLNSDAIIVFLGQTY